MRRILLTGMSGVGKSAVAAELRRRGYRAVDTDHDAYKVSAEGEWLWDESEIERQLSDDSGEALFVIGTASNQTAFYARFDRIVLLSAPPEVMVERVLARTSNRFGQADGEMSRILADKQAVEPMLRRAAQFVVNTDQPLGAVVDEILETTLR